MPDYNIELEQTVTYRVSVRADSEAAAKTFVRGAIAAGDVEGLDLSETDNTEFALVEDDGIDSYIIAWSYDWSGDMAMVRGFCRVVDWLVVNFELDIELSERPDDTGDPRWKPFAAKVAEAYDSGKWKALEIRKIDTVTGGLLSIRGLGS